MTIDAIEHNSFESTNERWSDLGYVYWYLADGRFYWYGEVIEAFIENAGVDFTGKKIADAGCAAGNALRYIHDNHTPGSLTGFDFSPNVLKWAKMLLPEAKFKVHNIERPIRSKFDIVLSFQVFEHLQQPNRALSNLMDALKAGGMLLLTVPDGARDGWPGHFSHWEIHEFEKFTGAQHIGLVDDVILAAVVKEKL